MKKILLLLLFIPTICLAQTITPIANIQDSISIYEGQVVTIQGIITIGAGITNDNQLNAFIQDNSGRGIELFDYSVSSGHAADLVRGNELQITGEVDEYSGVTEIKDFSWTVISTGNPEPTPLYLDLSQYLLDYEGTLVRTVGEITDTWYAGGGTNIVITDYTGIFSTTVRVWDSTGLDLSDFVEGYILEVVGVGGLYSGAFQILPGYQDQMRTGEFDNYPYGDISTQAPNEPIEITFEYAAVFESVYLFWKNNTDVEWNFFEMVPLENRQDIYSIELPEQKAGRIIQFFIIAYDADDNAYVFPEGYPDDENVDPYFFVINVPKQKAVLTVPPKAFNPYDGETFPIEFGSRNGDKAILRIYNAEGKLVFEPQNNIISSPSGITTYDWNGKDKENKIVPLGLYICYLEIVDTESGHKKTAKAPIVVGAPLK
jgi:DNA/RNA endonuclease YhcR with UshA esterase domain